MPKDTYFNLPEQKRQRILDAAVEEFRDNSFEAASVNRMVERAGIAKGSFYQYFEDKKDLFLHILEDIAEKKLEYLSPVLQNPQGLDLFTLTREIYASGLRFGLAHPQYLAIGNRLLKDTSSPIYQELMEGNQGKADAIFLAMFQAAQQRGELREGLDLPLMAHLFTTMHVALIDYYVNVRKAEAFDDTLLQDVEQFIEVLKSGIAVKEEKAT